MQWMDKQHIETIKKRWVGGHTPNYSGIKPLG